MLFHFFFLGGGSKNTLVIHTGWGRYGNILLPQLLYNEYTNTNLTQATGKK